MTDKILYYRSGQDRNEPNARTHTYAETESGLYPMCGYGWNRSDGYAFSVFRGGPGTQGDCLICLKNVINKRPPIKDGWSHKTKWL